MATTMGVAIFSSSVLGVLSTFLIADFGLNASDIGWLAAVVSITAAVAGPWAGAIADRIGARPMIVMVFLLSGVGLLAISASPVFTALIFAGVVAGLGQAGANPATNKLIRALVPTGRRGLVTGVKQSGVQVGLFVGGLAMPTLALALGWRLALSAVVVVPMVASLATIYIVPRNLEDRVETEVSASPGVPKWVHRVALQGLLVGLSVGAMVTYLPLYAQTEIGISVVTAGAVASTYAVSGFLARLAFPHFGQKARHLAIPMLLIALIALVGALLLWAASLFGEATLWVGASLAGALSGWNALGMLSVITRVEQKSSGAASGVVTRGFGLGVAIGPPIFGTALVATGDYHLGFAIVAAAIVGAALLIASWLRSEQEFPHVAGSRDTRY